MGEGKAERSLLVGHDEAIFLMIAKKMLKKYLQLRAS